jgi:hypothetical protein
MRRKRPQVAFKREHNHEDTKDTRPNRELKRDAGRFGVAFLQAGQNRRSVLATVSFVTLYLSG